jgi:membrane-associated phospholipid phosphatase
VHSAIVDTSGPRPVAGSRSFEGPAFEGRGENPALVARPGALAERIGESLPPWHPAAIYFAGLVLCWATLALATTLVGLAFTTWILPIGSLNSTDEAPVRWLVDHRTSFLDAASYVGSEVSGGYVVPALVGAVVIISVFQKRWLLAGFVLSSIVIESGTYRATVFFVDRNRPDVERLENLPVDASYPSGHTAASIAVYWGFALLLTSRMSSTWAKVLVWTCAVLVTPIVATSRMYRGMHHPLDCVAGLFIGIAALSLALLLARVTGHVARRREEARTA